MNIEQVKISWIDTKSTNCKEKSDKSGYIQVKNFCPLKQGVKISLKESPRVGEDNNNTQIQWRFISRMYLELPQMEKQKTENSIGNWV